jgi:hypothetical protein
MELYVIKHKNKSTSIWVVFDAVYDQNDKFLYDQVFFQLHRKTATYLTLHTHETV